MLQMLIFSKNRPCQLDALIRSIKDNYTIPYHINILYLYTTDEMNHGYKICQKLHSECSWILQTKDFKSHVLDLVSSEPKYTTFFTDDDIITGKVEYDDVFRMFDKDENILTIALRMGLHCNWNYVNNNSTPPPKETMWRWKDHPELSDWGYPMSIQGNIFRTKDIAGSYLANLVFTCPNHLEGSMYKNPINRPYMICYPVSKAIGLQVNRVASTSTNRYMGDNPDTINTKWLQGLQIALKGLYGIQPKAPDIDYEFDFEKRI